MKRTFERVVALIVLVLSLIVFSATGVLAQTKTVEQKGNVFIQKSNGRSGSYTKTNYIYEDSKGNRDTIYISSNGKAFVFKVSKNGNVYRKYLPEVTEKLGLNQKKDEKAKSN